MIIPSDIPGLRTPVAAQPAHRSLGADLFEDKRDKAVILGLRLATPHTNAAGSSMAD